MDEIQWLNLSDGVFYAMAWALAFSVGVARSLYDDMFRSVRVSLVIGVLSGFVAAGAIAVYFLWASDGVVTKHVSFLGVAVIIGLFAKQHIYTIELLSALLPKIVRDYVARKFGIKQSSDEV